MSKYVKNKDSNDPWMIDESNQVWTLGNKATIAVTGEPAINIAAGNDGNLLKLRGDIDAKGAGSQGLFIEGDNTTVRIRASSLIEARDGIYNTSAGSFIENKGVIDAKTRGIASDSDIDIVNSGRISADSAIAVLGEATITNLKGGRIEGDAVGIRVSTFGSADIINHGKITAEDSAIVVNSAGNSELNNYGKIVGDVMFGAGHDRIDSAEGKIVGKVSGGPGNDDYSIGSRKFNLVESFNSGYDRVFSSADHTLRKNFEELQLAGDKSVDGTGNGLNNMVRGNEGDNVIRGKGGNDYLGGNGGEDLLVGGGGGDYFIFNTSDGHDTIADLNIAKDDVALLVDGYDSFDDVAPHISQHGDDTWISLGGGDRIILKNIDADDVTEDTIIFNIPM